jgi:hypothetical protein
MWHSLGCICRSREEKLHDSSVEVILISGASDGVNDEWRCATSRRNDLLFAGDVVAIRRRCGSRWESSNERGGKEHDGQVLRVSSNAQWDGAVRCTRAHEWQSKNDLKAPVVSDLSALISKEKAFNEFANWLLWPATPSAAERCGELFS